MSYCPNCEAKIPLRLALKSTDGLLFPSEVAKCPTCNAQLIPTGKSVAAGVAVFLGFAALVYLPIHFARFSRFGTGFPAGLLAGIAISFGGLFVSAKLLRFRRKETPAAKGYFIRDASDSY
jgi:hypothetical protein